ncbi:MAG: hypothetical protein LBH59_03350 [Planctomycetaceae bacterium]|nr:hypothetical protein [Planctomycetaceae bacterium]
MICISVDGLHSGMIGAYGNGWIQTPAFDSLAVRSVVFDRYYAASVNLLDNFDLFWADSWLYQFAQNDGNTILITDDNNIFNHANTQFAKKYKIESQTDEVVEDAEDTTFFKIFTTLIDQVVERGNSGSGQHYCIWTHLCGFRGVWDFPFSYRERHRDEEDPLPYQGSEVPRFDRCNPDELQAVMEAYSGGISLLDDMLAGLLDSIESCIDCGKTVLAVFGTRGFSLGEHKKIGANYELFGENIHLPLFIRLPNNASSTMRISELLNPADLADFFNSISKNQIESSKILQLTKEIKTSPQHEILQIKGKNNEVALVTPNWFIRRNEEGKINIYVKPDDRWEINNVSNRLNENSDINSILKNI